MHEDDMIDRLLPSIPGLGWTRAALVNAAGGAALAENAFPRGPRDAVASWSRREDRRMAAAAGDLSGLRVPQRIRRVIEIRLEHVLPHKEALRGAVAVLAAPWNAPLALTLTAETVSAMWYAAGDSSADFSWYTRRASLAGVYGTTLTFWLRDPSPDLGSTLAFLDRRLADLHRLQRRRKAA